MGIDQIAEENIRFFFMQWKDRENNKKWDFYFYFYFFCFEVGRKENLERKRERE